MRLFLVTPSFNQAHFLADNLRNVAALGPNVDHHVQDGASTDGTAALLVRSQRPHFTYASTPDHGIYDALHRAFDLGRGEVLGWLNCDDLLLPYTAELVLDTFAQHPAVDVVYGDALELTATRVALTVTPSPRWLRPFMAAGAMLPQPAVFFRRTLWNTLGGLDLSYRLLADADLWLRALKRGSTMLKLPELLAVQRMVPGQLMEQHAGVAQQEWQRLRAAHGLDTSLGARVLPPALHRAGLLSLVGHVGALWPRAREAQVVLPGSVAQVALALLGSTRGRVYLQAGPGLTRLLESPPPVHNGAP